MIRCIVITVVLALVAVAFICLLIEWSAANEDDKAYTNGGEDANGIRKTVS